MTNQGYFLTEEDFRELESISIRLAHFSSVIFEQMIDCEYQEDSLQQPQQTSPEPDTAQRTP